MRIVAERDVKHATQKQQQKRLPGTIAVVAFLSLVALVAGWGTGRTRTEFALVTYAQTAPGPVSTQATDANEEPLFNAPYATPFPDVNCTPSNDPNRQPDYFCLPSTYMASRGWISGYTDGTFKPWNDATRGQVAKIVVSAEGWPIDTSGGPHFTDVAITNPFYQYIETAYNHGIISGYSDGTFRPYEYVTRGQFSKIIVLARGWPLQNPATPHFTDVPTAHTFYTYIETAYNYGIISGYSCGTNCLSFLPEARIKRGQITKMVYKAEEQIRVCCWGYNYDHEQQPTPGSDPGRGVHQGSNNYNCTGTNGYRCTSGNIIEPPGYFIVSNYKARPNFYSVQAKELRWTQSAKSFLQSQAPNNVDAIVFHATKWDSDDCTAGNNYTEVSSTFPSSDPSDLLRKESCTLGPWNELRVPLRNPGKISITSPYEVTAVWSTNTSTHGDWYPGKIVVDNYLVESGLRTQRVREYMQKFCYQADTIGGCPWGP